MANSAIRATVEVFLFDYCMFFKESKGKINFQSAGGSSEVNNIFSEGLCYVILQRHNNVM